MKSKNQSKISVSKKAQFGTLADVWSFIIWVFVIIIFMIIFSIYFKGCMDKKPLINKVVTDKSLEVNAQTSVINFLRTPVGDKTVADVIIDNYAILESQFKPGLTTVVMGKDVTILKNSKEYEDMDDLVKHIADKTGDGKKVQVSVNYPDYPNLLYGNYYGPESVTDVSVFVSLPLHDGKIVYVVYTKFKE